MNIERRTIKTEIRMNTADEKKPMICGRAAVFNSLSEDLGGFREQIMPGAFKEAITGDVRALFNHQPSMILGRSVSGTLRLTETEQGLEYECDMPDTSYARDLKISMERGDVDQCSFGFSIPEGGDSWEKDNAGKWTRTIRSVSRLYDVSPVTYPAYPDAKCALRSLERAQADIKPPFDDTENRRLWLEIEAAAL